ncbi:MAG: hypothetical protein ACXWU9_19645, partial [Telluria sp.]
MVQRCQGCLQLLLGQIEIEIGKRCLKSRKAGGGRLARHCAGKAGQRVIVQRAAAQRLQQAGAILARAL